MEWLTSWTALGVTGTVGAAAAYRALSPSPVVGPEYPLPAQHAVRLPAERPGESQVLRHVRCRDGLIARYDEAVRTTADHFRCSVRRDPSAPCLGWRETAPLASAYSSLSYGVVDERARALGRGFHAALKVPLLVDVGVGPNWEKAH